MSACSYHDIPQTESENRAIEFGVASDLAVDSKAAIGPSNYQDFGFVALGAWKLGTMEDDVILGEYGTEVRYDSGWYYSPLCYWKEGVYDFAAVMPSSLFAASHEHTGTVTPGTALASMDEDTHKTLTLDFGDGGYDLSAGQHDIMVAFSSADNGDRTMGTVVNGKLKQVSLAFEHQLSLVSIKAATTEPRTDMYIKKIEVYGNSKATTGDIVFTYNKSKITSTYTTTGVTSATNPYKTISPSNADDWKLPAGGASNTLVPELLVFPEVCDFTIAVTYADRYGKEFTGKGTISADWAAGKKYSYSFTVSLESIAFAEPTIEPWPSEAVEIGSGNIEM